MTAWIVRAGASGANERWNLQSGRAGVGFAEVGDLTGCLTREQVREVVDESFAGDATNRRANFTGQLWALRGSIRTGDLIVMPLKRSGQIALGLCTEGYSYDAAEADKERRHHIKVDWSTEPVSRSAFKDDLLNTVNGAMTVFSATRNQAEQRLRAVLSTGIDPGASGLATTEAKTTPKPAAEVSDPEITDPDPAPTLVAIRDRIRTHIVENFAGHKLTDLVAEILTARGYVCDVSPPGPDGGVDILAGRGPLGLDAPTVVVEVKSELTAVGAPVVRGLQGAISTHQADQGLLVAWGGVSSSAKREFTHQRTRIRIWTAEDILDQLFDVYEELSDEFKNLLPLQRAWILEED